MTFELSFGETLPDKDQLEQIWLCEIEKVLSAEAMDDRNLSFFVAGVRLAVRYKSLRKISVSAISNMSGYSRATFFRNFGKYHDFALEGYGLTCKACVQVFKNKLQGKAMDRSEFVSFTSSFFYGANICVPSDIVRELWTSRQWSQEEFHPHLPYLARIIGQYLRENEQTRDICVSNSDLLGAIKTLDLDILITRMDERSIFPTLDQYRRLSQFLEGFLMLNSSDANRPNSLPLGQSNSHTAVQPADKYG